MMSGLILLHDFPARDLANARPRHAAGVNLHFDAARMRPDDITFSFAVRQQAVVVENKFYELDAERGNLIEILFGQSRNQQQRPGMDFDAGWPQVVVAALGDDRHRQRRSSIRRQAADPGDAARRRRSAQSRRHAYSW